MPELSSPFAFRHSLKNFERDYYLSTRAGCQTIAESYVGLPYEAVE